MIRNEVVLALESGMEASPIALLVQTASKFNSSIYLETGNKRVNAKSIMGMMSMAMMSGDKIVVEATGEDEAEASEAVIKFLTEK